METYANIHDYFTAADYISNKESRPVAHNTRICRRDNAHEFYIQFHESEIITYTARGETILNSCGWKTKTTKDRFNAFLPDGWRIYQENSQWHIRKLPYDSAIFSDGMIINPDGTIASSKVGYSDIQIKKLLKTIKKYVNDFTDELIAGKIPAPSAGDCFYCGMREVKTNLPLGELNHDTEHIFHHFEEYYFVPSLLTRAMEYTKQTDFLQSMTAGVAGWIPEYKPTDYDRKLVSEYATRALTRYLKHCLNIPV